MVCLTGVLVTPVLPPLFPCCVSRTVCQLIATFSTPCKPGPQATAARDSVAASFFNFLHSGRSAVGTHCRFELFLSHRGETLPGLATCCYVPSQHREQGRSGNCETVAASNHPNLDRVQSTARPDTLTRQPGNHYWVYSCVSVGAMRQPCRSFTGFGLRDALADHGTNLGFRCHSCRSPN